jgi:hypothetical protein
MKKPKEQTVEKHLEWEPSFDNQIDIEDDTFTITLKKDEIEIECSWDYGWAGRGTERMFIPISKLEALIKELKDSHTR